MMTQAYCLPDRVCVCVCVSGAAFLRGRFSRLRPGPGGQRGLPAGRLLSGLLQSPGWQVLLTLHKKRIKKMTDAQSAR